MKIFRKQPVVLALAATLLGSAGLAQADVIADAFQPYRNGVPQFAGLTPGMVINPALRHPDPDCIRQPGRGIRGVG